MYPASYKRCAIIIVLATGKYNFLEASCCKVEVVNGAAGAFFAGFVCRSFTLKSASIQEFKKASASFFVLNVFGSLAFTFLPSLLVNSASILKEASGLKSKISRSRSTINRTATDCTLPAESPPFTLRHKTGDNS